MAINKIDAGRSIRKYREAMNDKEKIIWPGTNIANIEKEIAFIEDLTKRGEGYQIKFNSYDEVQRYVNAMRLLDYYGTKMQKKIRGMYLYEDLDKALAVCKTKVYNGYVSFNYVKAAEKKITGIIKVLPKPLTARINPTAFLRTIYNGEQDYKLYINSAISRVQKVIDAITLENKDKVPKLIKRLYIEMRPNFTQFNKDDFDAINTIMYEARVMTMPKGEDSITEADVERLLYLTIDKIVPSLRESKDEKLNKQKRVEAAAKEEAYAEMLAEKQPSDPDEISAKIMASIMPQFNNNPAHALNQLQQAEKLTEQLTTITQQRNQILNTP